MKWVSLIGLLSLPAMAQQQVQLQWTPNATPQSVVRVYRATTCAGPFVVVANNIPQSGPWNTVIPSTPGSTTAFQVTSVLGAQESAPPSNCFLFTIPPIPPPVPLASPTGLSVVAIPQ